MGSQKFEIWTFMGSFCPNHVKFQLKSTEELSIMTLKSGARFDGAKVMQVIQSLKKN